MAADNNLTPARKSLRRESLEKSRCGEILINSSRCGGEGCNQWAIHIGLGSLG